MSKNGRHRSTDFFTNRRREAIIPVSFCTSLILEGGAMSRMTLILSGLASIPRWQTRKPRNLPDETPNVHLRKREHNSAKGKNIKFGDSFRGRCGFRIWCQSDRHKRLELGRCLGNHPSPCQDDRCWLDWNLSCLDCGGIATGQGDVTPIGIGMNCPGKYGWGRYWIRGADPVAEFAATAA